MCLYVSEINTSNNNTIELFISPLLHSTANPEKLILAQADYPADRNLTEEEHIGPEISHDISVNCTENNS